MEARELKIGEIVQINPDSNDRFGGCLMIVSEPKSWGAQGYVTVPHAEGPQQAYFRTAFENIEPTNGAAEWLVGSAADKA
ncbi:hypothetical protein N8569_00925 [bacterium]|nr:hypothetical protein [bacterium]